MQNERRKELLAAYKEQKTIMGVVQIKNEENGKIFIAAFPNLKNKWTSIQAQLDMGRHMNSGLQKDWNTYGKAAFSYSILEEQESGDEIFDVRWEVKQLEKSWCEKLQPYDERGYNRRKTEK